MRNRNGCCASVERENDSRLTSESVTLRDPLLRSFGKLQFVGSSTMEKNEIEIKDDIGVVGRSVFSVRCFSDKNLVDVARNRVIEFTGPTEFNFSSRG